MSRFSNISDGELEAMYNMTYDTIKYDTEYDDDDNESRVINLAQFTKKNQLSPHRHSLGRGWAKYGLFGNDYSQIDRMTVDAAYRDVRAEYGRRQKAAAAPPPPAPKPAPPPTPKVDQIQQTYQKQIADLTKRIDTIQKTPPKANVPPPKPPTTPYSVRTSPISLSNPYKSKTIGGIGQFKQQAKSGVATIKSNLINI